MVPSDSQPLAQPFCGLDLLSSAVVLLDAELRILYLNPAAENLFAANAGLRTGRPLSDLLGNTPDLTAAIGNAVRNNWSYTGQNITVVRAEQPALHLDCVVSPVDSREARLLLEFRPIDQRLKVEKEERLIERQQASRELIRNLAHEIKNPLGGIRGSAQLLERELGNPQLREYTQVIIQETDRLQDLMQRLLNSHRAMQPAPLNIHEILERVRLLIHGEFPQVEILRDYDASLPESAGDREQLIQAFLNIVRNAAQAIGGAGQIRLRTRSLRQVTLAKRRYRLAIEVGVVDSGPGIPEELKDKIFYPLVSGREGGSGLGLTIAQSFIEQHHGSIDVESRPGRTCFTIVLPIGG
jgi:two-component system nitrogen regulation sensor histidine kinase GlnL